MKHSILAYSLLLLSILSSNVAKSEPADLLLGRGAEINPYSLQALQSRFQIRELVIQKNPAYEGNGTAEKARTYKGIRLKDLLTSLLPAGESLNDYVLAVTCLDGYDPVLDQNILTKLSSLEGLVAFEQLNISGAKSGVSQDGKWELVPAAWGIVNPGPFYLVWNQPEGTYGQGWPFQIKSLQLIKNVDYQNMVAKLLPPAEFMGKTPKTAVEDGYNQFRGKCLTCHNINGVGGRKANIDLMVVIKSLGSEQSISEFLKVLVRNPPPGMSDIKDIKNSDEDLAHIAAYLKQKVIP